MGRTGDQWCLRAALHRGHELWLLRELDDRARGVAAVQGIAGELFGPIREPWRDTPGALAYRWQTRREGEPAAVVVPLGDDEGTATHDHHDDEGGNA